MQESSILLTQGVAVSLVHSVTDRLGFRHRSPSSTPTLLSNQIRANIRKRKQIVRTTVQKVVTTHASVLLFGGLSKFGVTPDGAARAGSARSVASVSGDISRKPGRQRRHNSRHPCRIGEKSQSLWGAEASNVTAHIPMRELFDRQCDRPNFAIMDRSGVR